MLITIDFRDKRSIYEQVSDKLQELILCGAIGANEALPSVRSLAVELSINPNTIQKAYDNLEHKGFCYSVSGRGRFAAEVSEVIPAKRSEYFIKLDALLKEGKTLGLSHEDIIGHIRDADGKD